jgi:hypothetical protein
MRHHDRHDERQRLARPLRELPLPDPHHVAEQPKGHVIIDRALVLEKEVDEHLLALEPRAVEQIAVPLLQRLVDNAAAHQRERRPVDAAGEPRRKHGPQLPTRMLSGEEKTALNSASCGVCIMPPPSARPHRRCVDSMATCCAMLGRPEASGWP